MIALFYLLYVALAGFAKLAREGLVVSGDPAATAVNIMGHPSLYQLGNAFDILSVAANLMVLVLYYRLLKPVNESISMLAAMFGFMGCILMVVGGIFQLAPPPFLGHAPYLSAFNAEQLQVQAYLTLNLYNKAYSIALVFFGLFGVVIGYLVFKSTFLPRLVGALMALAGVAFLTFLAPAFAARNFVWILPLGIGEGVLILWLLIRGVDAERWAERADELRAVR